MPQLIDTQRLSQTKTFPKQPFFSFGRRKRLTVPSSSAARVSAWSYTAAPAPLHAHPPTQARYIQRLTGDAQTRIEILRLVLRLDLIRDDHGNDNSGRDDNSTHTNIGLVHQPWTRPPVHGDQDRIWHGPSFWLVPVVMIDIQNQIGVNCESSSYENQIVRAGGRGDTRLASCLGISVVSLRFRLSQKRLLLPAKADLLCLGLGCLRCLRCLGRLLPVGFAPFLLGLPLATRVSLTFRNQR